jgi:hypothetical protein
MQVIIIFARLTKDMTIIYSFSLSFGFSIPFFPKLAPFPPLHNFPTFPYFHLLTRLFDMLCSHILRSGGAAHN